MLNVIEKAEGNSPDVLTQPRPDSLEGHLHQVGEDVLGIQRDAVQVSVLLDEVEELRGVGHPEGQRSRDVLLLLQRINHKHRNTGKKRQKRELLEQQQG